MYVIQSDFYKPLEKFGGKGKLYNLAFKRTISRCIRKEGLSKVTKGLLRQVIRTSNYKSSHQPSTFALEIAERGGFIRYGLENRLVFLYQS